MGGLGSGQWYRWSTKTTVEDCRVLSACRWMREGILKAGVHRRGSWVWSDADTGVRRSSIGYEVSIPLGEAPWVRLKYTLVTKGEALDYRVGLQSTTPEFGGLRWWFTCPLVTRRGVCLRRCGKLYLPPNAKYYGCRRCYNLSYASQREDRANRLVRKANKIRFGKLRGCGDDFVRSKPKGMHWSTYERLCIEEESLLNESLSAFLAGFGR